MPEIGRLAHPIGQPACTSKLHAVPSLHNTQPCAPSALWPVGTQPISLHAMRARPSTSPARASTLITHAAPSAAINSAPHPDHVITEKDLAHLSAAAALSLASCGETQPHPNAACILVGAAGDVIAEAFLSAQGTTAPEVQAARAAGGAARGGSAYLNLETGDCHGEAAGVRALIASGVRRVVVGLRHPLPALRGVAIEALRAAGIDVAVLSEAPCSAPEGAQEAVDGAVLASNEPLLHVAALGRPLGVLKYAMTLDGKIAATSGHSAWVSGPESRRKVFETRARSDAVIVGGQTVRRDDPRLTTRREGGHQPTRIVMSRTLDLPVGAALWDTAHAPTIVATQRGARADFQRMLRSRGVEVLEFDFLTPAALADYCRQRGYLSLLWECGGTLAAPAISGGAVHRVMAFIAPKIIGGSRAPTPVGDLGFVEMTQALPLHGVQWTPTGSDLMLSGYLPVSGGARALAAQLGLRPVVPVESEEGSGSSGNGSQYGAKAGAGSVGGVAVAPAPAIGFYKAWDKWGAFSNFTPHEIIMPEGQMTADTLAGFRPRRGDGAPGAAVPPGHRAWPSTEHYYQAQKFAGVDHPDARDLVERIAAVPSPEAAAALGRRHDRGRPELLRTDWSGGGKVAAMHAALRAKFAAHEGPRALLLGTAPTGDAIIETAPHDYYWAAGMDGSGLNMLGKLLMAVREEIQAEEEAAVAGARQRDGGAAVASVDR